MEDNANDITKLLAGISRELRCSIWLVKKPFWLMSDAIYCRSNFMPLSLNNFKDATTTPCGHTFCKECIERVLSKNDLCPRCDAKISIEKLHIAYSVQEIVKEFIKMRDHYQSENDVILSQAPIALLAPEDALEQTLSHSSRKCKRFNR